MTKFRVVCYKCIDIIGEGLFYNEAMKLKVNHNKNVHGGEVVAGLESA